MRPTLFDEAFDSYMVPPARARAGQPHLLPKQMSPPQQQQPPPPPHVYEKYAARAAEKALLEQLQQQVRELRDRKPPPPPPPPPPQQQPPEPRAPECSTNGGTYLDVPKWAFLAAGSALGLLVLIILLVCCVYLGKTASAIKHLSRTLNHTSYYPDSSNYQEAWLGQARPGPRRTSSYALPY